jgi:hypothetical protein
LEAALVAGTSTKGSHGEGSERRTVKVATAPQALADEVDELTAQHRDLERRLHALDRHLALSAEEQLERTRLKKEKLRVKDRLLLLETRAAAPRHGP